MSVACRDGGEAVTRLRRLLARLWYEVYCHGPGRRGVPVWRLWLADRRARRKA
jgi:hypothetical protein